MFENRIKILRNVMSGALVAAMSVPAFAGVASYDIGSLNAKNAYSYAAAEYANAIHEAAVAQAAVDPAAPVVVAATDGTQIVYANYSEYAAAMANLAREAFSAQVIDNAAALGYGVN